MRFETSHAREKKNIDRNKYTRPLVEIVSPVFLSCVIIITASCGRGGPTTVCIKCGVYFLVSFNENKIEIMIQLCHHQRRRQR
jgi:hypothetical protein